MMLYMAHIHYDGNINPYILAYTFIYYLGDQYVPNHTRNMRYTAGNNVVVKTPLINKTSI